MAMTDPDIPLGFDIPPTVLPTSSSSAPMYAQSSGPMMISPPLATASMLSPSLPPSAAPVSQEAIASLKQQGFTTGLAKAMTENNRSFPLRIWIVDNSGSMSKNDGHRLVETTKTNDIKIVPCTRWKEIQETVKYHIQMSAILQSPTEFRMLNSSQSPSAQQYFSIAERGSEFIDEDVAIAMSAVENANPYGVTPLSHHIREIRAQVLSLQSSLLSSCQRVAIIIATDGLPTDNRGICNSYTKQEFVQELRNLECLPVWVVIRLCTDEDDVVDFYNELDNQLELSMEVLDDFRHESKEISKQNKWLNYTLPIHRCREMGYQNRLFDLLDERPLSKDELRDFFFFIFGRDQFDGVPDAQSDWKGFVKSVEHMVNTETKQWNPRTKRSEPYIDIKLLNRFYKNRLFGRHK